MRNKAVVVLLTVLAVTACGHKHRPVYEADDAMPHWTQSMSQQQIEDLIVSSCTLLNWKVQRVAAGHLRATQSHADKFWATVDILFDQQHFQIRYNSSEGLNAEDGTIHNHYNTWVHSLEREIQLRFNNTLPPVGQ